VARSRYEAGVAIAELPEQDNVIEQGRLYRGLGDVHRLAGRESAAREAYEKARERFTGIDNRFELQQTERCQALLDSPVASEPPAALPDEESRRTLSVSRDESE